MSDDPVTRAILRWLLARERVLSVRSASQAIESFGRLGVRVGGGRPPEPKIVGLVEAERCVQSLTPRERWLLTERYWRGDVVTIERIAGGVKRDYHKRTLQRFETIAVRSQIKPWPMSPRAARKGVDRARAKVGRYLEWVR